MSRGLLLLGLALLSLTPAPSGAALWQAERAWSEEEEAGFARFVESEVDADFFVRGFATCSGLPLRLVEANSSSCFSLIDLYMLRDAPLSLLGLVLPRLAESAAPAAFCCAADLAGMVELLVTVTQTSNAHSRRAFPRLRVDQSTSSGQVWLVCALSPHARGAAQEQPRRKKWCPRLDDAGQVARG